MDSLVELDHLYRQVADVLPCSVYAKDLRGVYLFHNQYYFDKLVRDRFLSGPDDCIVGKTDGDLFGQAIAEQFSQNDRHVVELGEAMDFVENATQENNLHQRFVSHKRPLTNLVGEVCGILGCSTEFTNIRVDGRFVTVGERALECLSCLFYGLTAKQTAKRMCLSARTVESHLNNLKHVLDCDKKSDFVTLIHNNDLAAAMQYFFNQSSPVGRSF